MKKALLKFVTTLLLTVSIAPTLILAKETNTLHQQTTTQITSGFNGKTLDLEHDSDYSFIVGGHLYGSVNDPLFPSNTLISSIKEINETKALFFASLGDIAYSSSLKKFFEHLVLTFTSKLEMPVFNAIGNHDSSNLDNYLQYSPTYFSFTFQKELFVFTHTKHTHTQFDQEQINFLAETLNSAAQNPNIKNIFIFSHFLSWSSLNKDLEFIHQHSNATISNPLEKNNFTTDIYPLLTSLPENKKIFWLAGDIGAQWSLPFFYTKDKTHSNITYIATGIGETATDYLLKVNIDEENNVSFKPLPLNSFLETPAPETTLEEWNIEKWKTHFSLKNKILRGLKKISNSKFTYYGLFLGITSSLLLVLAIKVITKSLRKK